MLTLIKIALSAALIFLVNEIVIGRSKPLIGSLIASLPLVSLITFVWINYDRRVDATERVERLASHSAGVFWFVLPSLPMFLLMPWLLRKGVGFWPTLVLGCVVTMILYALMAAVLKKFGIEL